MAAILNAGMQISPTPRWYQKNSQKNSRQCRYQPRLSSAVRLVTNSTERYGLGVTGFSWLLVGQVTHAARPLLSICKSRCKSRGGKISTSRPDDGHLKLTVHFIVAFRLESLCF